MTREAHEHRTVKRENDELRKQKFLSLLQALAFSQMCPLFNMTDDNVKAKLLPHLATMPEERDSNIRTFQTLVRVGVSSCYVGGCAAPVSIWT